MEATIFEDTAVYIVVKCAQRYCNTSVLSSGRIDNNTIHRPSSAMKYNLHNYYNENYLIWPPKIPYAHSNKNRTVPLWGSAKSEVINNDKCLVLKKKRIYAM